MFPIIFSQIKSDEDRVFFENLYHEKHAMILNKIKKQVFRPDDAEELEQEVWKRLIENTDKLRDLDDYRVGVYIIKTINSVRVDYIRRQSKAEIFDLDGESGAAPVEIPTWEMAKILDEKMAYEQLLEELPSIVRKMTATEQSVYHYRFEMKESVQQIAEHLHISEKSVRKYISRTKQSLLGLIKAWAE